MINNQNSSQRENYTSAGESKATNSSALICTIQNGLKELQKLSFEAKQSKYPNVPADSLPPTKYDDKTANGLTRCIIDFLKLKGWQAERINNTGRVIDRRTTYTDVLGRNKTIGSVEWVKGTGTDGTADVSATIAGKSVKIEIKIGNDKQSQKQKDYQAAIEKAGGVYFVAKSFQGFYEWYCKNF
jgi:hypothetical protein